MKRYPSRSTRTLFYSLAGTAGFFTALFVVIDAIAVNSITGSTSYTFFTGLAGFVTAVCILATLAFCKVRRYGRKVPLGLVVDPAFRNRLFLPRTAMSYVAIASVFNTFSAVIYFAAAAVFDPTIMLPLMQFVIIYLVLTESIIDRDSPSLVEVQSLLMVALGAFLATIKPGELDLLLFCLVLGPLNLLTALSIYFQKKAKAYISTSGEKVDSIRLRFWMACGLAIGLIMASLPFLDVDEVVQTFIPGFLLSSLSMTLAFAAYVCYIRALGMGKMYVVEAVSSSKIVFSIPISILTAFLLPDLLQIDTIDAIFWLIKIIGIVLVSFGVIALALAEVRQYLFIVVAPGKDKEVMDALFNIKGVTSVAAVAGDLDIIAKVRVRTIGKALSNIITKVEQIQGVLTLQTALVLKEKERFGRSGAYD